MCTREEVVHCSHDEEGYCTGYNIVYTCVRVYVFSADTQVHSWDTLSGFICSSFAVVLTMAWLNRDDMVCKTGDSMARLGIIHLQILQEREKKDRNITTRYPEVLDMLGTARASMTQFNVTLQLMGYHSVAWVCKASNSTDWLSCLSCDCTSVAELGSSWDFACCGRSGLSFISRSSITKAFSCQLLSLSDSPDLYCVLQNSFCQHLMWLFF